MITQMHFLTFSEQVKFLKEYEHIDIPDIQYANEILQHIGYFSLIEGYKHLFQIPFTKKYKTGTSFYEIVSLYQFDAKLREIFLEELLQIERHIGNLIAYYFIEQYGILHAEYLNPDNYNNISKNEKTIKGLIKKLYRIVHTTDYEYINYYRKQHENIPLWATINALTFGSLSKMYHILPQSIRSKVCRHFPSVNQKQLDRFLSVLTKYRNVCAHSDRLFTYKTIDQIPDTSLHMKLEIPKQGNQYTYGKQDLFSVVIAFYYLLSKKDSIDFIKRLHSEMKTASEKIIHITNSELLCQMGFPNNWESIINFYQAS